MIFEKNWTITLQADKLTSKFDLKMSKKFKKFLKTSSNRAN